MSGNWDKLIPAQHVVIIEGDVVVQMLLKETLAELGFSSTAFDNAISALTYLLHIQGYCSLIIADQGPPGSMQGTEFILMAKKRWPSIPSILVTGYLAENQDLLPSTTYLKKPYTLVQLERSIAKALSDASNPVAN